MGDHDALKHVLLILLDNALGYTSAETTVELAMRRRTIGSHHRARYGARHPAGCAVAYLTGSSGRGSRSGVSTGLGLAIAKELVEAQGGAISVDGQLGQGSVFTVTLPRANHAS